MGEQQKKTLSAVEIEGAYQRRGKLAHLLLNNIPFSMYDAGIVILHIVFVVVQLCTVGGEHKYASEAKDLSINYDYYKIRFVLRLAQTVAEELDIQCR